MAGEAFQFDWSEDWAIIGGERTKLQVAHFKLSYSRAFILRAYPQQTHEMLFDAHNHAFRVLGGVPRRGIYDNMRTAVDKIGRGKERQVNARFSAMVSHFLFEAEFCNPASGWEKGQIEKNVQDARHRLWQPMPDYLPGGAERLAGDALPGTVGPDAARLPTRRDRRRMGRRSRAPDAAFAPVRRLRRTRQARVADVPGPFGPQSLQRAGVVRQSSGQPAGVSRAHRRRRRGAGRVRASPRFCPLPRTEEHNNGLRLAALSGGRSTQAGALRNGAPFVELPPAFRALQQRMLKTPGGDREMVEILALVLQHDEQAVLTAVELALEAGVPTKTHILNLLHRLIDGKPIDPPVVKPPNALTLTSEPQANVERYDALRQAREARHAS